MDPAPPKGFLNRGSEFVKNNATMILIVLIVLIVLVLYFVVYYRGIWKIGPMCKSSFTPNDEIERLVKAINAV